MYNSEWYLLSDSQRAFDLKELAVWLDRVWINKDNFLILDTETTGLIDCEVIELALTDFSGNTLMNQRIKPRGNISEGARACHGIRLKDLKNSPTFPEIFPRLKKLIEGKTLLIYNAYFDISAIASSLAHWCIKEKFQPPNNCVMQKYAVFCGQWSYRHGSYTWQKLPKGDHSALGDCLAIKGLISRLKNYFDTEISASSVDRENASTGGSSSLQVFDDIPF